MSTITPTRDTITLTYTLTAPLHHGAGSSGNTAILRTHEVIQPDGSTAAVPFVSGNSIRHALRAALAWRLADLLSIPDGSLSKGVVDLLWSGGAVTTTGARTNLAVIREVERLVPSLSLLGFAAQSDIHAGVLRASDAILVCSENVFRLPEQARALPHAQKRAGAYRTSEFGTRHDVATTPVARLIDLAEETTGVQMIFDHQALKAGSVLVSDISLDPAARPAHRTALGAALALWAPGGRAHLAAKSSAGWGACTIDAIPTGVGEDLAAWEDTARAHRDEILALLTEIVGA